LSIEIHNAAQISIPSHPVEDKMKIDDLLNPTSRDGPRRRSLHATRGACESNERLVATTRTAAQSRPKNRLVKDAPVFKKNEPKGDVEFPPHETEDEHIRQQHKTFRIFPKGCIADFPRHIPYNSDKIDFLAKTGRDAFEGNTSR
jgi:hypothetical protein